MNTFGANIPVKIGHTIIELDSVDSTNNYLSKLANETIVENGSVILAHYQTHGKGQRGNNWESEAGSNLTFSVYLNMSFLKLSQNFLLSMMVCNSVHELISNYSNKVEIKWPNDLLIESKKVCGILIENSIQKKHLSNSIIGIGLNVSQTQFAHNSGATSLQSHTSETLDKKLVLKKLLAILDNNYNILTQGNQLAIKNYYYQNLLGYQTGLTYEWKDTNSQFLGEILDVEDTGLLKMKVNQKEIRFIEMKEIRMVL